MTDKVLDPWDAADQASEETAKSGFSSEIWGQVNIQAWDCALVKGTGKVPFDPSQHKRKSVAIDLFIYPISEMNLEFPVERHFVDFEPAWYKLTKQSAHDIGIAHVRELQDKFVKVELIETGETYEKNGKTVKKTTPKFLIVFPDQSACVNNYMNSEVDAGGLPWEDPNKAKVEEPQINGDSPEKAVAIKYLKPFVAGAINQSKTNGSIDLVKLEAILAPMLATQTLLNKYFTVNSPEVTELVTEAMK
jgi:hypothetical protein